MSPVTNERVLFNAIPDGQIEIGKTLKHDTSQTIDVDTVVLNGGILLKTLVVSPDPFLRELMVEPEEDGGFLPGLYLVGEPITGFLVAVVLRSEQENVKVGDHYLGMLPFQSYTILPSIDESLLLINNEHKLPWSTFLGVCGMPGHTAYMAWKEYSKAKKGEIAYVTAGAGPVGSFVIQLAKRDGLKVIVNGAACGANPRLDNMDLWNYIQIK